MNCYELLVTGENNPLPTEANSSHDDCCVCVYIMRRWPTRRAALSSRLKYVTQHTPPFGKVQNVHNGAAVSPEVDKKEVSVYKVHTFNFLNNNIK